MQGQPLDELYLRWLYSQVADPDTTDRTVSYWKLLRQLYTTPFIWIVPNDDNRLEDGKELRREFLYSVDLLPERNWAELDCSVLELVVGLSRRLEFETGGESHYWFWRLLENIGLRGYTDAGPYPERRIEGILYDVTFRQYNRHGLGGFFPLQGPCEDQRKVELWYQLSAYVLENT